MTERKQIMAFAGFGENSDIGVQRQFYDQTLTHQSGISRTFDALYQPSECLTLTGIHKSAAT